MSLIYTLGNSTEPNPKTSRSLKTSDIQESMRYDQGSSGYKDWLTKLNGNKVFEDDQLN